MDEDIKNRFALRLFSGRSGLTNLVRNSVISVSCNIIKKHIACQNMEEVDCRQKKMYPIVMEQVKFTSISIRLQLVDDYHPRVLSTA